MIKSIKIMLDPGAKMPQRAHETDAGMDIFARESKVVSAREAAVFDTGVHIQIPKGYYGRLASKSGLNVKAGLVSEGVIDSGYTGSIVVKLYNHSSFDYSVQKGDKISQLIIEKCELPELEYVDEFEKTERGDSGFGSTGK